MNAIGAEALRVEINAFFSAARSRVIRSIRQFAEEEIVIKDGPVPGPFKVSTQPAIGLWFDEIDSGRWNEMIFTAPSQWGKTVVGFIIPALYHIAEMAEHYILAVPDMRMGQNKWEIDLRPAFEASPTLRHLLPKAGEGSRGGKINDSITFTNGKMFKWMTAGGDDTQKAGFTARVVGVTEAARFSESSDTSVESDPLRQLEARQRSHEFHRRRSYVEGTVTIEEELPWRARSRSSKSQIVTPCPHCGAWIAPEREHLIGYEEAENELEAAEMAAWFCYKCGELITEEERLASVRSCRLIHAGQSVNEHGDVIGEHPKTMRLWFRATPWLNSLLSTSSIAIDEWKSLQIEEDSPERVSEDKRMCQFVWCIPYKPPQVEDIEIDRSQAARRTLAGHPRGVVPDDTTVLTVATDVGKWDCWWVALAIRSTGQRHIVDYGRVDVLSGSMPEEDAVWQALGDIANTVHAGWRKANGEIYYADAWWIDKRYQGKVVERFARKQKEITGKQYWCLPTMGIGESQAKSMRYDAPRKTGNEVREIDPHGRYHLSWVPKSRVYVVSWDADDGKLRVQNSMVIPVHKPGAMTLFVATARDHRRLIRHMTNERRVLESHALKGEVLKWKRVGDNHWLDCLAQADTAARRVMRIRERKLLRPNPFAEKTAQQSA